LPALAPLSPSVSTAGAAFFVCLGTLHAAIAVANASAHVEL